VQRGLRSGALSRFWVRGHHVGRTLLL
jgi:hypothetical protein